MSAPRRLLDDCFLHDKDRLRHDDAINLLRSRVGVVTGVEEVGLDSALGRVLARAVVAPNDVPAFTNAAVDGYAVCHADLAGEGARLPVVMRIAAGHPPARALRTGEAARIFTGAAMPEGADTCIMQEDVTTDNGHVTIPPGARRGANVRKAGEDLRRGDNVVCAGTRLRQQELAAVASTGRTNVTCYRKLKVALISTGDEVIRPGAAIKPGQVYDTNHHLLSALMSTVGAAFTDFGILPDDAHQIRTAVKRAAVNHDVILTTGGASRGETDHMVETIQALGRLHAWQIAVKPGRPLAFGQIGDTVFLGLPGNPVAVFVCFLLYAQPLFAMLTGQAWRPPQRYLVPAGFRIEAKKPDRREFWRGWIDNDGDGARLQKFQRDGSALISGLTSAGGLIEVLEKTTAVGPGDLLGFIPFTEFGLMP